MKTNPAYDKACKISYLKVSMERLKLLLDEKQIPDNIKRIKAELEQCDDKSLEELKKECEIVFAYLNSVHSRKYHLSNWHIHSTKRDGEKALKKKADKILTQVNFGLKI